MSEPRYVIIHGHFYQPPRESPWTGLISPEPGAAPFPNWNERILSECYTANGRAHTMDGRVVHIRNNYAALNFDFGPTLIGVAGAPRRARLSRDPPRRRSSALRERGGHGNAIAQSYNHSILPLLRPRDRALQIAWGIEDFVSRFKRRPEGMWLPECAVDRRYAARRRGGRNEIHHPGARARRVSRRRAQSDRGAGPFIWRRGIAEPGDLSFRPRPFARGLLRPGLQDGVGLANSIAEAARAASSRAECVMVATDGETFGHHKRAARPNWPARSTRWSCATTCGSPIAPSTWRCIRRRGQFRDRRAELVELPARRRAMARGLRMPPGPGDQPGMARAAARGDGVREQSCHMRSTSASRRRWSTTPCGAAVESIRLRIDPNPALHEEFFVASSSDL